VTRAGFGASFAAAAAEYERGRPGWPPELLDALPLGPDATVLDLAAGTGKLTRVLAERHRRVVAVEPLDELRAELERAAPAAEALAGRAEEIPLADGSVDAVLVAQAFHWFEQDAAVAEIARVLRPGGVLALLWNERRPGSASPLPAAYAARFAELRAEAVLPELDWDALARGGFGERREAHADHEQVSARADVLAFAASLSWIASRADRDAALAGLAELLPEGEYRFALRARVRWARNES
jgi:SAM-dependent methyltransferase